MKRTGLLAFAACVAACSAGDKAPRPPAALPPASRVCYAGKSTGAGEETRTIARRTVDPATGTITEDVSHDGASAHGATSFHVVMAVTGDQFTMTEASGAFEGSGQLMGEPWKWNQWTSTSHIAKAGITVTSDDELVEGGMTAKKRILKGDQVLGEVVDDLHTFDCAQWEAVKATLAVPPLDDDACKRACTNYATLKYWEHAEHTPDAEAELAKKLAAGGPACVLQCRTANNAVATQCMADAKTVEALATCNN